MRPWWLVVALAMVVAASVGCSSNNKGVIEGTRWSNVATTLDGNHIPAGAMRLEFGADGSLVYQIGPTRLTGRYKLGVMNLVTLDLDQELAGQKSHLEQVSIEGDRLTMTDLDGTGMTFQRER